MHSHIRYLIGIAGLFCCLLLDNAFADVVKHGPDKSVCNSFYSPGPTRPVLADKYKLSGEINTENHTTDFIEYFDLVYQTAALSLWKPDVHVFTIYSHNSSEQITVTTTTTHSNNKENTETKCTVDDLDFEGFKEDLINSKKNTAYSMLRLAMRKPYYEHYMGETRVRGILAGEWKSCQYWSDMDATIKVHWFFTAPSWSTADGITQVPVRCLVTGNIWEVSGDTRTARTLNYSYEFSEYRTDKAGFTTKIFETPSGVVCPGRRENSLHDFPPTPPNSFHYKMEILQPASYSMATKSNMEQWYDKTSQLTRSDYMASPGSTFGSALLHEVHDFNEGISYIMDPEKGNCTIKPLDGAQFDSMSDGQFSRMRTPLEHFYLDVHYEYEGVKNVRGIDCDVYITQRSDWPHEITTNSTWEWYFATQTWVRSVEKKTGKSFQFGIPLKLKLNAPEIGFKVIYNIYNYDEDEVSHSTFDISSCLKRKHIMFKLPGSYQQIVAGKLMLAKNNIIKAVASITGLSPLKITNVNVDFDNTNILVSLILLGQSGVKGTAQHPPIPVSLEDAASAITNAIKNEKLVVKMNVDVSTQKFVHLVAQPYSLQTSTVKFRYFEPGR